MGPTHVTFTRDTLSKLLESVLVLEQKECTEQILQFVGIKILGSYV
jgi:hypothetical protein